MDKVYVFGHKRPDTDSVMASITLAYLKNQLGMVSEPRVLGNINQETKYVLNYFKVEEPKYLNNVRLQIRDVDYHRGYYLKETASILEVYQNMIEKKVTGIPLIDEDGYLKGLITEKMLIKELVGGNDTKLLTTYDNILHTLEGEAVLRFDNEIERWNQDNNF